MWRKAGWAILLLLGGCGPEAVADRIVGTEPQRIARAAIEAAARGDDAALDRLGERGAVPSPPAIMAVLPARDRRYRLAEAWFRSTRRIRTTRIAYEVTGGGRQAIVQVTMVDAGGGPRVERVTATPLPAPLAEINALTLRGKGIDHLFWLAVAGASLGIALWAMVRAIRTERGRRRWLWAVGSLIGVIAFRFDWTSGRAFLQPFVVAMPPVALGRIGFVGPWMLIVRVPAVAIVFLLRDRARRRRAEAELAPRGDDAIARP